MKRSECFRVIFIQSYSRWGVNQSVFVDTFTLFTNNKDSEKILWQTAKSVLAKNFCGFHPGQKSVECTGCLEGKTLISLNGGLPVNVSILMKSISQTLPINVSNVQSALLLIPTLPAFPVIKNGKIMRLCSKLKLKEYNRTNL